MIRKLVFILFAALLMTDVVIAQSNEFDDDFNRLLKRSENNGSKSGDDFRKAYEDFKGNAIKEYRDFRDKCNKDYAEFMRQAWESYRIMPAIDPPVEPLPNPPIVIPDDDDGKPIKSDPMPIDEIISPDPIDPQPNPVEPVQPAPQPIIETWFGFSFFGTKVQVRLNDDCRFSISTLNENTIADTWEQCSDGSFDLALKDCLDLRENHKLCDWAYLNMLRELGDAFLGKGTNEARFFSAWLFCQSGYQIRLAIEDSRLLLLFGSKHTLYSWPYFSIDGTNFYILDKGNKEGSARICEVPFVGETALSMYIPNAQEFDVNLSGKRKIEPKYYTVPVEVSVNKNLIDFYNAYPTSEIGDNFMTRWAMYANTPMDSNIKTNLYPILKKSIEGKSELQQVQTLLSFLHNFEYGLDDEIWGQDRAFFCEESLYYPKCDCEDHAILFSRLVRDLVGLEVILVYYPGHLASAVHFNTDIKGDYIMLNGDKYVVCDPTYYGAEVGRTMPDMDNNTSKVILLDNN